MNALAKANPAAPSPQALLIAISPFYTAAL
jgi:hypothetical protein